MGSEMCIRDRFDIGPDGYIYLPEIREVYAEGKTVDELKEKLLIEYEKIVISPSIYLRVIAFRPVKVFVIGEVKRPGFYVLSGINTQNVNNLQRLGGEFNQESLDPVLNQFMQMKNRLYRNIDSINFPTVFDAIRISQGITPYSDLSEIELTRINAKSRGGGHLSLIHI